MALYNNFPATYQQQYYPVYQQPVYQSAQAQQTAQTNSNLIWVQGEAGAKSYLVAPNTTVQLWDSERQTIYLKSADASGMPSMKVLDYTMREMAQNAPVTAPNSQADKSSSYATKAEIDGILTQIQTLRADVDKIKGAEHE